MAEAGATVGGYRLERELGRGATGVVWEAVDERLGRRVALKALSDQAASTPDARARFAREAKLLATIAHPHVATVYGVVEQDGQIWLALELMDGETLADRMRSGRLDLEDALELGRQIADGMEAAHEAGVIHRDLKPANVGLTASGAAKVLDFGLAKESTARPDDAGTAVTTGGAVLGTPLYMSPEQVRGKPIDRRVDAWAFGCVLWEMLTGARPFERDTVADVVHAILESELDLDELPPRTPPRVRELIERCLERNPRRRLRDLGEARVTLEAALDGREWTRAGAVAAERGSAARRRLSPVSLVLGVALGLALGAVATWLALDGTGATAAEESRPLHLELALTPGAKETLPTLSPDGRLLVHEIVTGPAATDRHLAVRRFDAFGDAAIPGTEGVTTFGFSPDGDRLAVVRRSAAGTRHELVVITLGGSEPPAFLGVLPPNISVSGGTVPWLEGDRLVLRSSPRELFVVPADGATSDARLVDITCDETEWPYSPDLRAALPGGRHVLASSYRFDDRGGLDCLVAIDVDTGEQTLLVERCSGGAVVADQLAFSVADSLYLAPFDADDLTVGAPRTRIASGMLTFAPWMSGLFSASRHGDFAWLPGGTDHRRELQWISPAGEQRPWSETEVYLEGFLETNPTGTHVTVVAVGPAGSYELWGSEIDPPRLRPLLADPTADYMGGAVRADTRELLFCRNKDGRSELGVTSLDDPGDGRVLVSRSEGGPRLRAPRLIRGGRTVTFVSWTAEAIQLVALDLDDSEAEPRVLAEAPPDVERLLASDDGRWILVGGRERPARLREVLPDGSLGPGELIATGGRETISVRFDPRPWPEGEVGITFMPASSDAVFAIRMAEDTRRFSEPTPVVLLDGVQFYDLVHLPDGRLLGATMDSSELWTSSLHVVFGAIPPR